MGLVVGHGEPAVGLKPRDDVLRVVVTVMRAEIREAVPSDVPSLEIVRRQAIEAGFEGTYDRADFADLVATPAADLEAWIEAEDHLALLVETDVTVAAFGVYDAPAREIRSLYTAPDYQRHGCATALLERFTVRASEDGADSIGVSAPRNAVTFFEANGFERRGTLEREGLSFVRLRKPLE